MVHNIGMVVVVVAGEYAEVKSARLSGATDEQSTGETSR